MLVAGADVLNGTPLLDIKPYVPYADARPQAQGGFAVPPEQEEPAPVETVPEPALPYEEGEPAGEDNGTP